MCRVVGILFHETKLHIDDFVPFSVPLAMYIFGNSDLTGVLWTWLKIVFFSSFYFGAVGFNAGHHHPEVVHEGDAVR